jgi:hypothetical protein
MRPLPLGVLLAGALATAPLTAQQTISGCQVLPTNNVWNTPVDNLPVAANSNAVIAYINAHGGDDLHPDFGAGLWEGAPIGIPYVAVPNGQAMLPIDFEELGGWPEESDAGPYPIPPDPPIEGGPSSSGDRHVLVLRQTSCILYELYHSWPEGQNGCAIPGSPPGWCGLSGAVYELDSNALRPDGWTSADAAGLPILPGLARWGEANAGEIRHALRFTVDVTRESWVWPARHQAGSTLDANAPPMGLRLRLRNGYDVSGHSPQVRALLRGLKKYGMLLADNGSNWYISGIPHDNWTESLVEEFHSIPGSQFEVVDVSSLLVDPDSGATPHLFSDGFDGGGTGYWSFRTP